MKTALAAAAAAEEDGYSVQVVDLRSISPIDVETLRASAVATGRVVVVHEASTFLGLGAEIAATITEECFSTLSSRRYSGSVRTTCRSRPAASSTTSCPMWTGSSTRSNGRSSN